MAVAATSGRWKSTGCSAPSSFGDRRRNHRDPQDDHRRRATALGICSRSRSRSPAAKSRSAARWSSLIRPITCERISISMCSRNPPAAILALRSSFDICTASRGRAAILAANPTGGGQWIVDHLLNQSKPVGVCGPKRLSGVEHLRGSAGTDQSRKHPGQPHIPNGYTEFEERRMKDRVRRADADVGSGGDGEPAACRGALHRGDHRLRNVTQREHRSGGVTHTFIRLAHRLFVTLAQVGAGQVHSGAERPVGAGDHHGAALVVVTELPESNHEISEGLRIQGIKPPRPVEVRTPTPSSRSSVRSPSNSCSNSCGVTPLGPWLL